MKIGILFVVTFLLSTSLAAQTIRTPVRTEAKEKMSAMDSCLAAYSAAHAEALKSFNALKKAVDNPLPLRMDVERVYEDFLAKRKVAREKEGGLVAASYAAADVIDKKIFPCVYDVREEIKEKCLEIKEQGRWEKLLDESIDKGGKPHNPRVAAGAQGNPLGSFFRTSLAPAASPPP